MEGVVDPGFGRHVFPWLAAEQATVAFPEHEFTAAAEHEGDYRRTCRRGYARMMRNRVAIAAVCRNVAGILPVTIRRLASLMSLFAASRVFVYENDSSDATKLMLRRWAARDRRIDVTTETIGHPVNPKRRCPARAERMARYRARCHESIVSRADDFDFVIVVDMDLIGGWSEEGVANSLGHDGWDFVGANGLIYRRSGLDANQLRQYDAWALRWRDDEEPLSTALASRLVPRRGEPLLAVGSCFGGIGIYTIDAFTAGSYEAGDCEHVTFHRSLRRRGFQRLFLNPSLITLYGRRHRSTDPFLRKARAACAWLGGVADVPWRYGCPEGAMVWLESGDERLAACA